MLSFLDNWSGDVLSFLILLMNIIINSIGYIFLFPFSQSSIISIIFKYDLETKKKYIYNVK